MSPEDGKSTEVAPLKMHENPGGLSLVKDSSTWLVTIQTAVLALVTLVVGEGSVKTLFPNATWLALVGVSCFAFSIIAATFVLLSIPNIRVRMSYDSNDPLHIPPVARSRKDNFYNHSAFDWGLDSRWFKYTVPSPPLWVFLQLEHYFFILGIIFFAVAYWLNQ